MRWPPLKPVLQNVPPIVAHVPSVVVHVREPVAPCVHWKRPVRHGVQPTLVQCVPSTVALHDWVCIVVVMPVQPSAPPLLVAHVGV